MRTILVVFIAVLHFTVFFSYTTIAGEKVSEDYVYAFKIEGGTLYRVTRQTSGDKKETVRNKIRRILNNQLENEYRKIDWFIKILNEGEKEDRVVAGVWNLHSGTDIVKRGPSADRRYIFLGSYRILGTGYRCGK